MLSRFVALSVSLTWRASLLQYNEVGGIASAEWTVKMRREMDAAGFAATKLVLPDIAGELPVAILDMIESNADYSAAVDILGVHYCGDPKCAHSERVAALGKEIWMTEGSVDTSVGGGLAWGASLNQNFVSAN